MLPRTRPAKPADVPAIRELVIAAYSKWVPVIGRESSPMLADYDKAILENRFDLVELDGRLAALIETIERDGYLWIHNLAVAPHAQGRGLGRGLLAHAEELALRSGRCELRLLTNEAFAFNVALYERHGYVIDRREPYLGGTTVHMTKRLAG